MNLKYLGLALGMAATLATAQMAQAEQISYNFWAPPSEPAYSKGLVPLWKAIAEDTDGELTAQIFTAGQMMGPLDTLGGIRDGAIQGGFVLAGFYKNELAHSKTIDDMVAFGQDPVASIGAGLETFFACDECQAEYKEQNLKPMGGHSTSPYILMCVPEIKSLEDFKGLRIRGTTDFHYSVISLLGGTGVNVSFPETSQAFERGSIDCFIGAQGWITTFGITELIKTTVPTPNFGTLAAASTVTFSLSAWDSWSDKVQKAVIKNMPDYVANATIGTMEETARAHAVTMEEGMKEVNLGPEYDELIANFADVERARLIASAEKRGVTNAGEMLETFIKNYEKWAKISAEANMDKAKFSQALWDEIYSKM